MSETEANDDSELEGIEITAEGVNVHASEKVSTGEYENAELELEIDASVEGADLTDGIPEKLRNRLYGLQRSLQSTVKAAGEQRQKEAVNEGKL